MKKRERPSNEILTSNKKLKADEDDDDADSQETSSTSISSGNLYAPNEGDFLDSLDVDVLIPYALTCHELYSLNQLDMNDISFLCMSLSFEDCL
ncbi:hypothetical protein RMATCC62417_03927 [Rhizopus microsporus]|nr:hypothetical protein RMATCC62417_03927 [Rhizopus microsporus]